MVKIKGVEGKSSGVQSVQRVLMDSVLKRHPTHFDSLFGILSCQAPHLLLPETFELIGPIFLTIVREGCRDVK